MHRHLLPTRRDVIAGGVFSLLAARPAAALANMRFPSDPFQLGVAAGDPAPDGFVLWTRLAPYPLDIGHGMPSVPVEVEWQVAHDEAFRRIALRGSALARPELAHAVHVEVSGLEPARPYFYRFIVGGIASGTGRARTAPLAGADVRRARFAMLGCQHYEEGLYTAHRHVAAEDLDFIYCYGDYIYEGANNGLAVQDGWQGRIVKPRLHVGGELYSLDDYRRRYALYKMDRDLQAAHASAAWMCVPDDHEVDNDWTGDSDRSGTPRDIFLLRRQAAFQAYYEHMPLRRSALPHGPDSQLYRRLSWGGLLDMNLLDTRQYRSAQACDDAWNVACPGIDDANRQVMGSEQEAWLADNVLSSSARWQVMAQQVMMMDLNRQPASDIGYNLDSWAGYRAARARMLRLIGETGKGNAIVLTGDEHQNFAGELFADGRDPTGQPVAVEFVGTSISSGGDGVDLTPDGKVMLDRNPFLKFTNSQRGYVVCDVNDTLWQTQFRVVDKVSQPGGMLTTRARFTVEAGVPVLHPG